MFCINSKNSLHAFLAMAISEIMECCLIEINGLSLVLHLHPQNLSARFHFAQQFVTYLNKYLVSLVENWKWSYPLLVVFGRPNILSLICFISQSKVTIKKKKTILKVLYVLLFGWFYMNLVHTQASYPKTSLSLDLPGAFKASLSF